MTNTQDVEYITVPRAHYDDVLLLQTLFDISPNLLCIAGFDGYFRKINSAVPKLLGYTEEELLSRPINDFVYEDDKERTSEARKNLYKNEPLIHFENRYVKKNGEIVWLSWTSMPEENKQLIFGIAKNISGRKKLEKERSLLYENIAAVNKELKLFAQATSHDLRSPLNNILTIFNLLDVTTITNPATLQLIELLKSTTRQLHETLENYINDLIKKDTIAKKTEQVNLENTLHNVIKSIYSLIEESNATISTDFSAFDRIDFNKTYLESIFLNLLTNAIKYTKPERTPHIRVYTKYTNQKRQLIISDNGLGFDYEKVQDRVFGLYETFHDRPDSKGIGLYLVHSHVTAMGANIEVESKVNEGTTFTISFKN
jgi:PAS domain S-box-containing protein